MPTCRHVLALLEEKLARVDSLLSDLQEFRADLARLRDSAGSMADCHSSGGRICGIIEGVETSAGSQLLAWLETARTHRQ